MWGGTVVFTASAFGAYISIHPPRVEWDIYRQTKITLCHISIHPPRVGWDSMRPALRHGGFISIHPPRVGWDKLDFSQPNRPQDFNPPTPCEVGLRSRPAYQSAYPFQSTHPVWGGTTCLPAPFASFREFQSTHPVWGGTLTIDGFVPFAS